MRKKAFTIVELLVAMGLLAVMMAVSAMVFAYAVRAQRTAAATSEIMSRVQALTQQLDNDLRGLRKDGEFLVVWAPFPEMDKNTGAIVDENNDTIPDRYDSFDRLFFFTDINAHTYHEQTLKNPPGGKRRIASNLAQVCYSFGHELPNPLYPDGRRATQQKQPGKRLFCRTQHLIAGDADLPDFPDLSVAWDAAAFETQFFSYEYQTKTMQDWLNWSDPVNANYAAKLDMLSNILDLKVGASTINQGGPMVDLTAMAGFQNLFSQGIGQFHVQIWRADLNRWFPELDPDVDGVYNEAPGGTDYPLDGNKIDMVNLTGNWIQGTPASFSSALKFTFTVYDSNGVFKEGKTFTHIVYLN